MGDNKNTNPVIGNRVKHLGTGAEGIIMALWKEGRDWSVKIRFDDGFDRWFGWLWAGGPAFMQIHPVA